MCWRFSIWHCSGLLNMRWDAIMYTCYRWSINSSCLGRVTWYWDALPVPPTLQTPREVAILLPGQASLGRWSPLLLQPLARKVILALIKGIVCQGFSASGWHITRRLFVTPTAGGHIRKTQAIHNHQANWDPLCRCVSIEALEYIDSFIF